MGEYFVLVYLVVLDSIDFSEFLSQAVYASVKIGIFTLLQIYHFEAKAENVQKFSSFSSKLRDSKASNFYLRYLQITNYSRNR